MSNAKMYHGQAEVDEFAKIPDDIENRIITTTMKEIIAAYLESIDDLLLEAQEAY